MIANFIIMFREALEAILVISIVLGYLSKTGQNQYKKVVWWGTIAGIIASILGAILFNFIAGGQSCFATTTTCTFAFKPSAKAS